MSSISSVASRPNPLQRLQDELSKEVSIGKIKSEDQDALSSALTSIDSSLRSGGSTSRPSPGEIEQKIGSLVDDQVEAGKLTADQASELKELFSNAA